jgi:hypothetical protein
VKTVTTYTLRFDGLPALLNQYVGRHWSVGYDLKTRDKGIVAVAAYNAMIPRATGRRRVSVCLVVGPRKRTPDGDSVLKSLLDALVACGALKNDSKEWCELGAVTFARGKRTETVVTLEDIGDA